MSWFVVPRPRPRARIRLVCFPYAGGSPVSFNSWAHRISEHIELCTVQLPGRDNRVGEPFRTRLVPLVNEIASAFRALDAKPFAVFGHSVGALMAYEFTRGLEQRGATTPLHLFVAGRSAPHLPGRKRMLHRMADDELTAVLQEFNGTPSAILACPEILEIFLPRLRADFELNETYSFAPLGKLECPMTVLGGSTDPETSEDALLAWRELGQGPFECRMLPGDHFFIHSLERQVLGTIEDTLLPPLRHVAS